MAEYLNINLLQIYYRVGKWKKFENWIIVSEVMAKSLVSCFFLTHGVEWLDYSSTKKLPEYSLLPNMPSSKQCWALSTMVGSLPYFWFCLEEGRLLGEWWFTLAIQVDANFFESSLSLLLKFPLLLMKVLCLPQTFENVTINVDVNVNSWFIIAHNRTV